MSRRMPELKDIGQLLCWSYANLAMMHSTLAAKLARPGKTQFAIRSRLYAGLRDGRMDIAPALLVAGLISGWPSWRFGRLVSPWHL